MNYKYSNWTKLSQIAHVAIMIIAAWFLFHNCSHVLEIRFGPDARFNK